MARSLKPEEGQSIIEFALILPLIALIMVGIIDVSVGFYDKALVTNASREGARQGSVFRADAVSGAYQPLDSAAISTVVSNYLTGRAATFGPPALNTAVNWSDTSPPSTWGTTRPSLPGGSIKVMVTYTYTFLALPRFAGWNGTTTITAETVMRME